MNRSATKSVRAETPRLDDAPRAPRTARALSAAALVVLVALACGRVLLNETPIQRGPLIEAGAYAAQPVQRQYYMPSRVVRTASAGLIVTVCGAWLACGALGGGLTLRRPLAAAAIVFCGAWLAVSASAASDKREAVVSAIEQVSLLACLLLTIHLADRPWRRRLILVALTAVTATLAAKAVHQVTVEAPENLRYFNEHRAEQLASVGIEDGTPQAVMFEARVSENTAKGYFSLANLFGSLSAMLTALTLGLGLDNLRAWRRDLREGRRPGPGEIPVPLAAGALCWLISGASLFACLATRSKGAIAACAFGLVLGGALFAARRWTARHRRAVIVAASLTALTALAAVALLGIARGSLPSRSMQVRWEYWLGSAELVAEHPWTGVGPGNFADPYLAVRPAGAEEAVKNPHNVIAQALAEYGLPAGLAYLAVLAWTLAALGGRRQDEDPIPGTEASDSRKAWTASAAVVLAAIGWKAVVASYPSAAGYVAFNFIAVLILPAGALVGLWATRTNPGDDADARAGRVIFAACGLGAFALHNLTDFALFKPATAMIFWLTAGALIAKTGGPRRRVSAPAAAVLAVVVVGGALGLWLKVYRPVRRAERAGYAAAIAVERSRRADAPGEMKRLAFDALDKLDRASEADPLDALYCADGASLASRLVEADLPGLDNPDLLRRAVAFARRAVRRDPLSVSHRELLLRVTAMADVGEIIRLGGPVFSVAGPQAPATLPPARLTAEQINRRAVGLLIHRPAQADRAVELLRDACERFAERHPALLSNLGDALYLDGKPAQAARAWRDYLAAQAAKDTPARPDTDAVERLGAMIVDLADRDPYDSYKRLWLAELAWRLGLVGLSERNARAAADADAALFETSVLKFDPRTRTLLTMIAARTAAAAEDH